VVSKRSVFVGGNILDLHFRSDLLGWVVFSKFCSNSWSLWISGRREERGRIARVKREQYEYGEL